MPICAEIFKTDLKTSWDTFQMILIGMWGNMRQTYFGWVRAESGVVRILRVPASAFSDGSKKRPVSTNVFVIA